MTTAQNVVQLVNDARTNAKTLEDRVSLLRGQMAGQSGSESQSDELRVAISELELAAVDVFTLFESRMQSHFKRGPFSRKLKAALIASGQADLADRVHNFYLAINVLKHGKGASYRELLGSSNPLFRVNSAEDISSEDGWTPAELIEICIPDFFDGLTVTLLEAYAFLEK